MILTATGWWTANHDLVILNGVLATAALATAIVGVRTIRSSNSVAAAATAQAEETKRLADLGRDQLEQERQALLTSVRPLIVDVPPGLFHAPGSTTQDLGAVTWEQNAEFSFRVLVPIRNIGSGPAFIREVLFSTGPGNVFGGAINRRVVPANELGTATLTLVASDPNHSLVGVQYDAGVGRISVAIKYADLGGEQRTQSVLHVVQVRSPQITQTVAQVAIYNCDESWARSSEPVVLSGLSELPWM